MYKASEEAAEEGGHTFHTVDSPDDGFAIEGGRGYIVNLKAAMDVTFEGEMWTNAPSYKTTPSDTVSVAWAFVVTGFVHDNNYKAASSGEYIATVK